MKQLFEEVDLELFPSGKVREGTLRVDAEIAGLWCAGGREVVFFESGRPLLVSLAAVTNIGGVPCSAGLVYLHENGAVHNASVDCDLRIDSVTIAAGTRVTLSDDGRLLEFWTLLNDDQVIAGVPCTARFPVWRYGSGELSCAVLSREHSFGSRTYHRWTEVALDRKGQVIHAVPLRVEPGQQYKPRIHGAVAVSWHQPESSEGD